MKVTQMKKSMTLTQWLIKKTNSEAYRAGRINGWKHPKVDRELIEAVGGLNNLLEQATLLEQDSAIGQAGKFKVGWRDMQRDISKIEYDVSIIPELCEREGIEEPRDYQQRILSRMQAWREDVKNYEWILPYYDGIISRILNGKEVSETEDDNLFKCLNSVVKQEDFVWERVFSARVLNDSKAFKKEYKNRIFNILKVYSPHYNEEMDIDELFDMHEIHSYTQTLEWKGPLRYKINSNVSIDSSLNCYGTVLNSQTIEHSVPIELPNCRKIMTIENKANYENMSYRDDVLYIYCHGYFSPKEVKFLKGVLEVVDDNCEFCHWGDMDFGGISIYQFVKERVFPKLKPYKMDKESFFNAINRGAGIELKESTRVKLESKDAGDLEELKEVILETNRIIEQEKLV